MYDVRCSSLPQYSTLVFTGSRPWIHWNNLLYSSQPFYRRLCEKSRCELYANCKFIISVKGLDIPDDLTVRLAEWIELVDAMGADMIFLYKYEVHPNKHKYVHCEIQT